MTSATHTAVLIAVSLLRSEKIGYLSLALSFLLVLLPPRSLSFLSRSHLIPCFLPSCLVTLLFFQPSHQKSNGGTVTLRSHIKCVHFKHIDISTRYIPSPSCYVCMSWLFHLRRRKRRQGKTLGPSLPDWTGWFCDRRDILRLPCDNKIKYFN